jgi:hypothetical protein
MGDSKKVLKKIIPELKGKTVFFLDAHWSGDKKVNWKDSNWKGYGVDTSYCGDESNSENQVPLLEEIRLIFTLFEEECVIYVDDADKFGEDGKGLKDKGFRGEDWSHLDLKSIKELISDRLVGFIIDKEQMVIKLKRV